MKSFYLFWEGFEDALKEELPVVTFKEYPCGLLAEGKVQDAAFCRQLLPNVQMLKGLSIKEVAEQLLKLTSEVAFPWTFHSYSAAGGGGRAKLVEEAFLELLKKKRRGMLKQLSKSPTGGLLQHLVISREECAISFVSESERKKLFGMVMSTPGGLVEVKEDKRPPARAYRKLLEALSIWGKDIKRGEQVVDLGASPGSWTWIAIERGAKVIAIDRSLLTDELMKSPRLEFVRGDAFSYQPEKQMDWLLCDVIAEPSRTIELVRKWTSERMCKSFCVTMKFKGDSRRDSIERMRALLQENSKCFILRHLESNKNEITAIGEC